MNFTSHNMWDIPSPLTFIFFREVETANQNSENYLSLELECTSKKLPRLLGQHSMYQDI